MPVIIGCALILLKERLVSELMHCHWHTSVFKFLATLFFILVSLYRRNHPYRHHEADLQYMAQVPVIKHCSFRVGCLTQLCAGTWGVEELESRRCPIESRSLFDDNLNTTKLLVSGELTVDASFSCPMDYWRWVTEDADDDSSMCSMGEIDDNPGPGRLIVFFFVLSFDLSKMF